jgi:hypothetical protein
MSYPFYDRMFLINDFLYYNIQNAEFFAPVIYKDGTLDTGPLVEFTYEKKILLPNRIEVVMCYV